MKTNLERQNSYQHAKLAKKTILTESRIPLSRLSSQKNYSNRFQDSHLQAKLSKTILTDSRIPISRLSSQKLF